MDIGEELGALLAAKAVAALGIDGAKAELVPNHRQVMSMQFANEVVRLVKIKGAQSQLHSVSFSWIRPQSRPTKTERIAPRSTKRRKVFSSTPKSRAASLAVARARCAKAREIASATATKLRHVVGGFEPCPIARNARISSQCARLVAAHSDNARADRFQIRFAAAFPIVALTDAGAGGAGFSHRIRTGFRRSNRWCRRVHARQRRNSARAVVAHGRGPHRGAWAAPKPDQARACVAASGR